MADPDDDVRRRRKSRSCTPAIPACSSSAPQPPEKEGQVGGTSCTGRDPLPLASTITARARRQARGLRAADALRPTSSCSYDRSLTVDALDDQPYWDIVTVLDLVCDLDADDWSSFDVVRLERYVEVFSR
jgi:hypothetical protein